MKKQIMAGFMALSVLTVLPVATIADERTLVKMPEDRQKEFLAMMRGFLESVDDMLSALAEGDLNWLDGHANQILRG